MLSDKGAIHSEVVQTVIGLISQSKEPLHECLNESLKDLCTDEVFNDLISNPEFSMEPILESINNFLLPSSNLDLITLENYSNFYSFMSEKLDQFSQAGQIALIVSINNCISYCNDRKMLKEDDGFKVILGKIIVTYKNIFKFSLQCHSKANLKAFVDNYKCVRPADIFIICREFLRDNDSIEILSDCNLAFLKVFSTTIPSENIPSLWISVLQIFARRFMKIPKHPDSLNGIGLILKMVSVIRIRSNNEFSQQLSKLTNELYSNLCQQPDLVDALISNDLFFGLDLEFFRSVKLETNLVNSFKKCITKRLYEGSILVEDADSLNLFDLYMKLEFGDYSDLESEKLTTIMDSDLLSYEVFSRLAAQNSTDRAVENLLKLWSQSYFISDSRHQIKFMNLLKISLLSQTSDSLGETLKRFVTRPFTVSSLCLLTCFPFSLWRSLEKSSMISNILADLISTWKYLTTNESSIDLLALILGAVSNLLNEAVDIIKKEEMKQILSLIPATLTLIRNNTTMTQIMKHKSAAALHKVLRSLLVLRDDKVLDIIDNITKLGSTESCSSVFDSWKSLSVFSLVKHSRDVTRLNKTVSDRIEMLIPKLFTCTEKFSDGPKLLVQHFHRHALYRHMRYTQDVNFFNNAVIQGENEQILNYIQDSSQTWSKGVFDSVAEENIWNQLHSCIKNDLMESPLSPMPVQISSSLRPSSSLPAILNLLKDDLLSLQRRIEDSRTRKDEQELRKIHADLQKLLK